MPRKFAKNKKKYWKHLSETGHNEVHHQIEAQKISDEASLFTISRSKILKEPIVKGNKDSAKRVKNHRILTYADDPSSAPRLRPHRKMPSAFEEMFDQQFVNDIWNDDSVKPSKVKKPPPSKYRVKKSLAAVPAPHPGTSYNPSFGEHQNLLNDLVNDEEKKLKAEKKVTNQLDAFFPKPGEGPTEASYLAEMSVGIFDTEEDVESSEEEDLAMDDLFVNRKPVQIKSKLTNRKLEEIALHAVEEKNKKKFANDLQNVPKLIKEIKKTKNKVLKRRQMKNELDLQKANADPREQPFLLSNELPNSLRVLKPQTDLLVDHITSLTTRRKLPKRLMKKKPLKPKFKFFEKK